jgi:hypothetical protein
MVHWFNPATSSNPRPGVDHPPVTLLRTDYPADDIVPLEDERRGAETMQLAGGRESGKTAANHRDTRRVHLLMVT